MAQIGKELYTIRLPKVAPMEWPSFPENEPAAEPVTTPEREVEKVPA